MRSLTPAGKWIGAAIALPLLALGVQSAWTHASRWIAPGPPPVSTQVDTLVHLAAQHGLLLDYQTTARLHPGREVSYVFVFAPPLPKNALIWPSSELRIYDLKRGRLRLSYDLRPIAFAGSKYPWTFGINILKVSDLNGDGADDIVVALGEHAADAVPTFPLVISWRAAADTYGAQPVMSRSAPPTLHGSSEWTRGYRHPLLIANSAHPAERFASYHAESVTLEPAGLNGRYFLLGIFYAHAKDRADPRDMELNIWSLTEPEHTCTVGLRYPPRPIFVRVTGFGAFSELVSRVWLRVHAKTYCY